MRIDVSPRTLEIVKAAREKLTGNTYSEVYATEGGYVFLNDLKKEEELCQYITDIEPLRLKGGL